MDVKLQVLWLQLWHTVSWHLASALAVCVCLLTFAGSDGCKAASVVATTVAHCLLAFGECACCVCACACVCLLTFAGSDGCKAASVVATTVAHCLKAFGECACCVCVCVCVSYSSRTQKRTSLALSVSGFKSGPPCLQRAYTHTHTHTHLMAAPCHIRTL